MSDIENIKKEYEAILQQLSDPGLISNWEKLEELNKRRGYLEKIIEKKEEIENLKNKIEENKQILKSGEDAELSSLAETEIVQLQEKEVIMEKELEELIKKGEEKESSQDVIMEIRAGTGGEEAALFAADLFKMYSKYAESKGWRQKVLESSLTQLGGYKEIIFELKGDVFSALQYEAGVHRIQRIPTTEKTGRIHTSTATVAVLPKPRKSEMKIKPDDLKIDSYHSSGAGGQNVNKRMTAVRITHLPTGIIVTSQTERSLLQNKENALSILEARLLEKKEMAESEKIGSERKSQIKWAKRAEKIRTYNFPQDRITDHRIKKNFHNINEIMAGNLEEIIKALQSA